jgi:hypothetical protein
MTQPDPIEAQWLQSEASEHVATDAALIAAWGDRAARARRVTALVTLAGAQAENARRLGFFATPTAVDRHLLRGTWADKIGQVISITGPRLGYAAGVAVFVIGVEDDRRVGTSQVTVLRRLA